MASAVLTACKVWLANSFRAEPDKKKTQICTTLTEFLSNNMLTMIF